jgi:hypothetical protein
MRSGNNTRSGKEKTIERWYRRYLGIERLEVGDCEGQAPFELTIKAIVDYRSVFHPNKSAWLPVRASCSSLPSIL